MKLFLYFYYIKDVCTMYMQSNVKYKYQGKHFQNIDIFFIQINQQINLHLIPYRNHFYSGLLEKFKFFIYPILR